MFWGYAVFACFVYSTISASIQLSSNAFASFSAVASSTSYSSQSRRFSVSASNSLSLTLSQRKAELSFMLIIFVKSMFSLPSATIILSPQMSFRTKPFFIFIFFVLLS